jgi:hypothetical protein
MSQHLERYKEGWRTDNVEMILQAVADDFVYDDPVDVRFAKADFGAYLKRLSAGDEAIGVDETFEIHTDEVLPEENGEETAWVGASGDRRRARRSRRPRRLDGPPTA